jgi:hypothetical protein
MQQNAMGLGNSIATSYLHTQVFPEVLREVKLVMMEFMAKPTEVLISTDEEGNVEEEACPVDVETIELYERMRETLIYLTNIDPKAMDAMFQHRLN